MLVLVLFKSRLSNPSLVVPYLILSISISISSQALHVHSQCSQGCNLALGSYHVSPGAKLNVISQLFGVSTSTILSWNWNPTTLPDVDTIGKGIRLNIPFSCDCINGDFLAHIFNYSVSSGDTYDSIASQLYSNLTTPVWLHRFNSYPGNNIPDNAVLKVLVNCSCGDKAISKDYGLFITWPVIEGDTLDSVGAANNLSADVVRRYNPTANFTAGGERGILYIPAKDLSGSYRPLIPGSRLPVGDITGISIAVLGVLFFAASLYLVVDRKRKAHKISSEDQINRAASEIAAEAPDSIGIAKSAASGLTHITVEKSVEFSYEELAKATDDFSLANKIGEGGFGSVYYAELRGEKAAIKKMDLKATREFIAELRVLTRVHHQNLVRLIGYCIEGSLFLVYEYIENGNLSQHLRGSDTLSWSSRVQIAVDSARGLEYIHEHTVPAYIHRDIKSANILIDKHFRAKVADFGLTKLAKVGSSSLPSRIVGTFGYMAPECARGGTVSPKIDVYAFGVVLYELISAKGAIVDGGSATDPKGLVALFEQVFSLPDPNDDLRKLVDPRLGDNYPLESVSKMFELAKVCTHKTPQLRPCMRSVVVALMTLSSSIEDNGMLVPPVETKVLDLEDSAEIVSLQSHSPGSSSPLSTQEQKD